MKNERCEFRLDVTLGNDAVQTEADVAGLLRSVARNLDRGLDRAFAGCPILDTNGNTVGTYRFVRGEEAVS